MSLTFPAHAGMTVYGLRDIYRLRIEEISFFIVLFLACAFILKFLWNHAAKGFAFLPQIKFVQSLCLSLIFGLLMLLVLTMISGIREVLTPDAWRRQGSSYRLNDASQETARLRSLEHLRAALYEYARTHEGKFPPHDFVTEIPEKIWESPDQLGTHYIYTGGLTTNHGAQLVAVEPLAFGESRLVLTAAGQIEKLGDADINKRQQGAFKP
ncbi:MAG: hypothetical protein EPO07_02775 [Verrucomicrobia bacterium]|nr:MAG: hypothetical protein EPO07_02775 [Verrucomicrobiota bacterium]